MKQMRLNMDMFMAFSNELTVNMILLLKKHTLIHKCTLNTNEYYPEKQNLNARREHRSSSLRYEFYFLNRNPVFRAKYIK